MECFSLSSYVFTIKEYIEQDERNYNFLLIASYREKRVVKKSCQIYLDNLMVIGYLKVPTTKHRKIRLNTFYKKK